MDETKTSAMYQHHAIATAALLIIQKTLEKLVQHGVITSEQLTDIYESIRQEHEERKSVSREPALHEQVGDHIRHAAEGRWPPDDIQ